MKFLLIAFILGATGCRFACATDLTAPELAQHLGVETWRIPAGKLPASFIVTLEQIKKGKVDPNIPSSGFEFHDEGDLVICAHREAGQLIVSLAQNGTVCWRHLSIGAFEVTHPIDPEVAVGEHLLAADYPLIKDAKNPSGYRLASGNIKDVTRGLVLLVQTVP